MRYLLLLCTIVSAGLFLAFTAVMPYSAGAPSGYTGASGASNCSTCHTGNAVDADGGSITLTGPVSYVPGTPVDLQLNVERQGQSRFGFSITVRDVNGDMVGTWEPVNGEQTAFSEYGADPTHVTHNPAMSTADGHTWALRWIPPAQDAGQVTFYAAGNAANGQGQFGDFIYTTTLELPAAAGTSTEMDAFALPFEVASVYPAPATDRVSFQMTAHTGGTARVHFYDASGRQVHATERPVSRGEQTWSLDLGSLPVGWYAWRVELAGHSRTGVLTLSR